VAFVVAQHIEKTLTLNGPVTVRSSWSCGVLGCVARLVALIAAMCVLPTYAIVFAFVGVLYYNLR